MRQYPAPLGVAIAWWRVAKSRMRAKLIRVLLVTGVLLGSMAAGSEPALAAAGDEVFANYTKVSGEFCYRQTVNAKTTASGTSGTVYWIQFHCDGSGYTGRWYNGTVHCLLVSGNTALVHGPITGGSAELTVFAGFSLKLEDNSSPSAPQSPDRSVAVVWAGVPTCSSTVPHAPSPILAGDIDVTQGLSFGGTAPIFTPSQ